MNTFLKNIEAVMRRMSLLGLACFVIGSATPAVEAGPTLNISSPANLSALTVGQTVEIDVTLSGLPANDFIFNLNSRILFGSLFTPVRDASNTSGLTAAVAPGSVFYDFASGPAKVANFFANSSLTSGAATGIFAESPNTQSGAIGLNGLYYSFLLQANSAGSGLIGFDPTSGANEYADNTNGFAYQPLPAAPGLVFTIRPTVVPEPSSLALVALGVAALGVRSRARGRTAG